MGMGLNTSSAKEVPLSRIFEFWFSRRNKKYHFSSTDAFDAEVRANFSAYLKTHRAPVAKATAKDTLSLIILYDQFPRHIFRGDSRAYSYDHIALNYAWVMIQENMLLGMTKYQKMFCLLPFMHSENYNVQLMSIPLFKLHAPAAALRHASDHCAIVKSFGKFPHRDSVLARTQTAVERQFVSKHPGWPAEVALLK